MYIKKIIIYKFIKKIILIFGLFFISLIIFTTLIVNIYSINKIFVDPQDIPHKKIILVLGTSKYAQSGAENIFYKNRIAAVVKLYEEKKIKKIIVSGHADGGYNEPKKMKLDLVSFGIPPEIIWKDEYGDRTIDSVLNLKNNYNIDSNVLIVSQKFHIQRALLIAGIYKIEATGFSADSPMLRHGLRTYFREIFARIYLLWDIVTL